MTASASLLSGVLCGVLCGLSSVDCGRSPLRPCLSVPRTLVVCSVLSGRISSRGSSWRFPVVASRGGSGSRSARVASLVFALLDRIRTLLGLPILISTVAKSGLGWPGLGSPIHPSPPLHSQGVNVPRWARSPVVARFRHGQPRRHRDGEEMHRDRSGIQSLLGRLSMGGGALCGSRCGSVLPWLHE
ncbi:hypothetical protein BGZ61DRAFT_197325 [Ilyonectria robusta]|uniref:uncharacterized protein n=1 Tax=Ilyonectria robusta TaxID=1079257 RepID=UPI001E8E9558|nr:uncharacterized protein BGZ61DRAFT_197325 [Ilyonectria robusta]KAH8721951.1 hypothetical protein BGZ61DRAFT_197325 [Ilyonectria robusta]